MNPSIFQEKIFDFIKNDTRSLKISAVAGSGKTTTVIECLKLIPPEKSVLMLAFNTTIAKELKERAPSHVEVKTFNGLGHTILTRKIGSVQIESQKMRAIIKQSIGAFDYIECGNEIVALTNFARRTGLLPNNIVGRPILNDSDESWSDLISHFSIDIKRDYRQLAIDTARLAIQRSIEIAANERIIDFDDQIYIPVIKNLSGGNKYDYIFVDEAQDASTARIRLVEMSLAENGRVIAVGDEYQAIYGFTGANSEAMRLFRERFSAESLPLSICYRCAKSIVIEAQGIMPTIQFSENAPIGAVKNLGKEAWDVSSFKNGDMIICRKNAPIVNLAWKLVSKGIGCRILGRDISGSLVNIIKKLKPQGLVGKHGLSEKLSAWMISEISTLDKNKDESLIEQIKDKCNCINAVLKQTTVNSVPDLIRSIEAMFSDDESKPENTITLCSVHKSKGLEADRVFILNRQEMPSKAAKLEWQVEQENNLIYVAITRAKKELFYIETE